MQELNEKDMTVTPFEVSGQVDYNKLVDQFGVQVIKPELISRFESLTGHKAHRLLRRGIFFAHRDFDKILDDFEQKKQFFIYSGRGPSGNVHIGHYFILEFIVYLQKAFGATVVFQIADDEKFFSKDKDFDTIYELGKENTVDLIALGFDLDKTFIFSNNDFKSEQSFKKVCDKLMKIIRIKDISATFGFDDTVNIGQYISTIYQMAAGFSEAFSHLFCEKNISCLIPFGIDQDVYFRVARDVAPKLGYKKPATIESKFLPSLLGEGKMSTTATNPEIDTSKITIFLTDTPNQIKNKINKFAFSGGKDTAEEHKKYGGNTDVDVSYQYLKHFLEDDDELLKIKNEYESGSLLSGQIKKICIDTLSKIVVDHQEKRKKVLQKDLNRYYKYVKTDY